MKNFKKLVLAGMLLGAVSASASLNVTTGAVSLKDGGSGPSVGINLTGEKQVLFDDFYIGAGIGGEFFKAEIANGEKELGFVLDVYPTIGYKFGDFEVLGLVGYSWGAIDTAGTAYYSGLTYGASLNYNFTENFGMGLNYKHTDANASDSKKFKDDEMDRYSLNFKWTY